MKENNKIILVLASRTRMQQNFSEMKQLILYQPRVDAVQQNHRENRLQGQLLWG